MQKLSEQQIGTLTQIVELNGAVLLQCDGFKVRLSIGELTQFRPHKTIKVVDVYVNGEINVKWCNYAYEESKFFMPMIADGNKTLYYPYFYTARSALEHINAASDKVVLLRTKHSGQL